MLVFYKEKLVFLAVPKTGTTAFETALAQHSDILVSAPPALKHAPVYRYNRFFRPMFEKVCAVQMETVAVMREPISWLGSWYRYRQRPNMAGQPNSTLGLTFDEFVRAYMKGNRPEFANVGSQYKFLEPRPNGCRVTHLFRYEEQPRLITFLQERLNVTINLKRENVSPELDICLSKNVASAFRQKFEHEFSLYDSIA